MPRKETVTVYAVYAVTFEVDDPEDFDEDMIEEALEAIEPDELPEDAVSFEFHSFDFEPVDDDDDDED